MNERSTAQPRKLITSTFNSIRGVVQRKCACGGTSGPTGECEACRRKRLSLQRKALNSDFGQRGDSFAPSIVHEVLRSPGQPLDVETRAFFEPRFGHDFSQVRVHTDAKAAESARSVNALAYTVGRDVVLGAGLYRPSMKEGRRLIAHELAHVIQQRGSTHQAQTSLITNHFGDADEHEADVVAAKVIAGEVLDKPAISMQSRGSGLRRQAYPAGTVSDGRPGCVVGPGVSNTTCAAYAANSWWLPWAYVNNATCACLETPNVPTAKCVRKFLQDRLAATPGWLKSLAVRHKPLDKPAPPPDPAYEAFVQTFLTPRIYQDHVDAYAMCCCSAGPAPYPAWIGVTSVPLPCPAVGAAIRQFGSCHGTPGAW